MRRLIAAAGIAAALAGCSSATADHGVSVEVDRSPFRISIVRDGKPVVREDEHARLRYQLASTGDQHSLTKVTASRGGVYQVATDEPGRTATVTVSPAASGVRIAVRLHPETDVQAVYDAFEAGSDEHFLGGGEQGSSVDLRGQVIPIKVAYACSYAPIPFFASSAGWGLRLASRNIAGLAFPGSPGGSGCSSSATGAPRCAFPALTDRTEVCLLGARLDEELYVGTIPRVLADYEAATGRPAVPPESELALIKWRDVNAGPTDVLEDVTRLQAARIPLGWVLLDNPWESCNGTLSFDRGRFPDPAGLIREVHARRVRFMLWVSPKATCAQGYPPGSTLGPPDAPVLDLRKPAVVAELRARIRRLVALGVNGVKGDRGDEVDLQSVSASLDNEYPLLFARAVARRAPARVGRDLPRGHGRVAAGAAGAVGRRPARGVRRAAARDRRGPDRRDERLPDLGLGRRRLQRQRPAADGGAVRALGAARGGLARARGRRARGRTRPRGSSAPSRWARSGMRPCCTTSSRRSSPRFCGAASRCCVRSPTATRATSTPGPRRTSCSSGRICWPRPLSTRA